LNNQPTQIVARVMMVDDRFEIASSDLRAAGVINSQLDAPTVDLNELAGATVAYLSVTQQLAITVPADWLQPQDLNFQNPVPYQEARASLGAAFNYDVYASKENFGGGSRSAFNEFRIFGNSGSFRSTGLYRNERSGTGETTTGFIRYDSSWQYVDQQKLLTYEVGDVVTNSLPWSSVVRLGGVQISREYSIRPDIITYPLPEFSGSAAVPSTVDVFINGYRTDTTDVRPGPFTLSDLPIINGAGEATLVTTDVQGRRVTTTAPFYVAPQLLREGFYSYSVSAGALRENFGISGNSYGEAAGSATLRYGFNQNLTFESHIEAGPSIKSGGLGALFLLSQFGIVNLSTSFSDSNAKQGMQQTIGYQYANRNFNVSLQHTIRSENYRDLSSFDISDQSQQRSGTQLFGGTNLGRFGNIGVGYLDFESGDQERIRLVNFTWSKPFQRSSFLVSARREHGKDWALIMQFNRRLGNVSNVNLQLENDEKDVLSTRVAYQKTTPIKGGMGWNIAQTEVKHQDSYSQLDLSWRGRKLIARAGNYGQANENSSWAELQGGLVWMKGQVLASPPFNDSFVLVSTSGEPNVPVSYENQLIGATNHKGFLLVPFSASFYASKYSIDILGLPANVTGSQVEQTAVVKPGAGLLLEFLIERSIAAKIIVVDENGNFVKPGLRATLATGEQTYVGWDGVVYFENLAAANNQISIELPEGQNCSVQFDLGPLADTVENIGPLTCK
ncbi:MAG: fimbria/pilus outer membrane usher protein, partial [Pseudomonadota bacterium]